MHGGIEVDGGTTSGGHTQRVAVNVKASKRYFKFLVKGLQSVSCLIGFGVASGGLTFNFFVEVAADPAPARRTPGRCAFGACGNNFGTNAHAHRGSPGDRGTGTQSTTTPCDRTFAMTLLATPSANGVVASNRNPSCPIRGWKRLFRQRWTSDAERNASGSALERKLVRNTGHNFLQSQWQ
jgi:hypothetical protein